MRLMNVSFKYGFNYTEGKDLEINGLTWVKEDNPSIVYNIKDEATRKEKQDYWNNLSLVEAILQHPKHVQPNVRTLIITQAEFETCYKWVDIIQFLDIDTSAQIQAIDHNKLAKAFADSILGATGGNLFNNKLEIHQPNMPLFTYNDFTYITDCCTELLMQDYINKGYRVVAVCPQPDQRRPDYILGRYVNEN